MPSTRATNTPAVSHRNPSRTTDTFRLCSVALGWLIVGATTAAAKAQTPQTPSPAPAEQLAAEQPAVEQHAAKPPMLRRQFFRGQRLRGSPEPAKPYRVSRERSLAPINFPICAEAIPGAAGHLLVIDERSAYAPSRLLTVATQSDANADSTPPEPQPLLSFRGVAYDVAFHPRFRENGFVYVGHHDPKHQGEPHCRITRYTLTREAPFRLDPESAVDILSWKSNGHNGSAVAFARDGMLLITSGDGTVRRDTDQVGQRLDTLRAKVLRIDVDRREAGKAYAIPADNPFVDYPGARPETWCYGLRNPWRISVDPRTGDVWVGNNGQDAWEQVYRVERGANYGWSVYEGAQLFITTRQRGPTPISPPTFDHPHSEARSLTGGVVYYGKRLPQLHGAYLYGDYSTGKIWAAKVEGDQVRWHQEIADTSLAITCFTLDSDGELLICDHRGGGEGGFFRLEPNPAAESDSPFPRRLSETELFVDLATLEPAAGVIHYEVNEPAWHDGATAVRHAAVPDPNRKPLDTQSVNSAEPRSDSHSPKTFAVKFAARYGWRFPDNTVLVQTLFAPKPENAIENAKPRKLETRILLKQQNEWAAYSYIWNERQTDARLAPPEGEDFTWRDTDGARRAWRSPARAECMSCHTRQANYALGLTLLQMNRNTAYPARLLANDEAEASRDAVMNQLDAWEQLGWMRTPQDEKMRSQRLPASHDETQPLASRARSYLHANCGHCHVPDGGGNAKIVLDWRTPLESSKLLEQKPLHGQFALSDAVLIRPGAPHQSVLAYRVAALGGGRMPRVGSYEVDSHGANLVAQWIASLADRDGDYPAALADTRSKLSNSPDALADLTKNASSAFLLATVLRQDHIEVRQRLAGAAGLRQRVIHAAQSAEDPAIRGLLEPFVPREQRQRRLGERFPPEEVLSLVGDWRRGEQLFARSSTLACRNCHQIGELGKSFGPRLDQLKAARTTPEKLLESMIDPDAEIESKFATLSVLTVDGRVLTGLPLPASESESDGIRLKTLAGDLIELQPDEIEAQRPAPTSLMPRLLLKDLTAQEAADLLQYLRKVNAK